MKPLHIFFALPLLVDALGTLSTPTESGKASVVEKPKVDVADAGSERDALLEAVSGFEPSQPLIRQWSPSRRSLWTRFRGTVLQSTLIQSLCFSALSTVVCIVCIRGYLLPDFAQTFAKDFRSAMELLDKLWHMHFSVVSFFLAFFLNTAKGFFDSVLKSSRSIQGRLNDINLLTTSLATRDPTDSKMTAEAAEMVRTMSRYVRVLPILFYPAVSRRYEPLVGEQGLVGLERRNLLTEEERRILESIPSPKQRFNAIFAWIAATFTSGCENGCIRLPDGGSGATSLILSNVAELRGACGAISGLLEARCPLSYVHFIQLLVDSFLLITPFAAVAEMGWFAILGTFLLSMFFSGLLDLSKMLYDPMDNDTFGAEADNIQIETLIQESAGASRKFAVTGYQVPSAATVKGGSYNNIAQKQQLEHPPTPGDDN